MYLLMNKPRYHCLNCHHVKSRHPKGGACVAKLHVHGPDRRCKCEEYK